MFNNVELPRIKFCSSGWDSLVSPKIILSRIPVLEPIFFNYIKHSFTFLNLRLDVYLLSSVVFKSGTCSFLFNIATISVVVIVTTDILKRLALIRLILLSRLFLGSFLIYNVLLLLFCRVAAKAEKKINIILKE